MSENWYERNVLPYLIDLACSTRPTRRQRLKVIPLAQGRVLEVGIGTGLNLPFYDRARVRSIVGVDPALRMHRLALRRIRESGLSVELIGLSAETLVAEDASFDTVVSTYTLCTIPDPLSALREMRRVLVPGGKLLFSEHGRAPASLVVQLELFQHDLAAAQRGVGRIGEQGHDGVPDVFVDKTAVGGDYRHW